MDGMLDWAAEHPGLFCATLAVSWGHKRHLQVEAVPDTEGWDWVAWEGGGSGRALHGKAETADLAMAAAERAAIVLSVSPAAQAAAAARKHLHFESCRSM